MKLGRWESIRVWWVEGLALIALAVVLSGLWLGIKDGRRPGLIVYCAHDAVYAEQILREFERQTGIRVIAEFDTEATKSLGLVQKIAAEQGRQRCDVFWNNEQLGTMWLANEGLLEPYKGDGYRRMPEAVKDPAGRWTGFAARMRVWIINADAMEPTQAAIDTMLASQDLSRVTLAKPLYGTTRTHYTILWDLWDPQRVQAWHDDWRARGVIEASGNAMVKNLVGEGVCHLGLTDTDDFFLGKDAGMPVQMLPVVLDDGSSIVIPNTVAIIKGTSRMEQARRLVEYLLSAETEIALSRSKSRQIPLGDVGDAQLSAEVEQLRDWAARPYPLAGLDQAAEQCLEWLRSQYVR